MPSGRLKIKDWERFQHFRNRNPPWIKLYRDLLDDPEWYALDGAASRCLIMCWLVASEHDYKKGTLPSLSKLAFRMRMDEQTVSSIITTQLSHWIYDDIKRISGRYHDDITLSSTNEKAASEAEAEAEAEGDKEKENLTIKEKEKRASKALASREFETVWHVYPRKTAKARARIAWMNLNGKRPSTDELIHAIKIQEQSEQWRRGIVPHFATWLHQQRWHDELPTQQPLIPPCPPANDPIARGLWHQQYGKK